VFDKDRLDRLLELHGKSYRIFQWVNEGLFSGRRSLAGTSDALSLAEAADKWMRKNAAGFPVDLRPAPDEVDELAHLFASYLATSFEVAKGVYVNTCRGCFCCGYWQPSRHLRPRRPGRKAEADAEELQVLYVRGLSAAMELAFTDAELRAFVRNERGIREELALATYVHELGRRSSFASQGEGVLVLWRMFAWKDGRLRRSFRLTADRALSAQEAAGSKLDEYGRDLKGTP
jgi:hypothetical protein